MAHPYHHSLSSVKKWGGKVEDYLAIHSWFDASKLITADFRHRALRHHAEGIFLAETIFGQTITLSSGRIIPTRWVGEQHIAEDLGFIPSFADWVIKPDANNDEYTVCSARNQSASGEPKGAASLLPILVSEFCYKLMPSLTQEIGDQH